MHRESHDQASTSHCRRRSIATHNMYDHIIYDGNYQWSWFNSPTNSHLGFLTRWFAVILYIQSVGIQWRMLLNSRACVIQVFAECQMRHDSAFSTKDQMSRLKLPLSICQKASIVGQIPDDIGTSERALSSWRVDCTSIRNATAGVRGRSPLKPGKISVIMK